MEVISPIFKDRENKSAYMIALVIVLTLAFCTLIAYTAFAATEAEPPKGAFFKVIDAASGTVVATTDDPNIAELKKKYGDNIVLVSIGTGPKTTCKIAVYKDRILGIFPNRETGEIIYEGVDLNEVPIAELQNVLTDTSKIKWTATVHANPEATGVKLRCPLKDGEFEFSIRKY